MAAKEIPMTRNLSIRPLRWMLLAMFMAIGSTVALSAWSMPGGRHGGEHGMDGMFGGGSAQMMGRRIDHMLDGLNASDAQRAQIKQIAEAAANDLRGQREQRRALRERSAEIFAAPNVDAAAAEQVRQQMLALHDAQSRRMTAAMIEAARVLTPEQRAKLGERMKARSAAMQERMQRMEREHPPARN
jgi:Spy/CpxP family protein refolding chaperone